MTDDLPPCVEELYANAASSGRTTGAAENMLGAAGMAGAKHSLATKQWRLTNSLDASEYDSLVYEYARMVRKQGERQSVSVTSDEAYSVAKLFTGYLICPICPTCQGRGASLLGGHKGGRAALGDRCKACAGTGKRSLRREARELGGKLYDLVLWLNGEVLSRSIAASAAIRRLKYTYRKG